MNVCLGPYLMIIAKDTVNTARHNAHLLHIVARDITKMVLFAQNALNWMASAEQQPDIQIMALPVAIYQMVLWVLMKWVNG